MYVRVIVDIPMVTKREVAKRIWLLGRRTDDTGMIVARVIVDVPARETDRPFDYEVPEQLAAWAESAAVSPCRSAGERCRALSSGSPKKPTSEP